jgi:hypothetical protein
VKIALVRISRRPPWPRWAVLVVALWLALGGATVWLARSLDRPAELCLFKRVTHLPCPTCGFTRGALHLLHGRPAQAWWCNPLLFSVLAMFLLGAAARIALARGLRLRMTRRQRAVAWCLAAALFFANWAYVALWVG